MYIFWPNFSSRTEIYYSRSKKIIFSSHKVVIKTCPLPQTIQIWDQNLHRLHDFGKGHELFDALKDHLCVAWWRRWYFWTRQNFRNCYMCWFNYVQQYLKNSSFFFFIFAMMNFDFFKSGSIENTAIHALTKNKSDFCHQLRFLEVLVTFYNNGIKFCQAL